MSVAAANENIIFDDGFRYAGLPELVRPFWCHGSATGDGTAGSITFRFDFNPNSQLTTQQYVQVSQWVGSIDVAGLGQAMSMIAIQTSWERTVALGAAPPIGMLETISLGSTILESVGLDPNPKMIGRIAAGSLGSLQIATQNTDTAFVQVFISGLISDYPIVALDTVRV